MDRTSRCGRDNRGSIPRGGVLPKGSSLQNLIEAEAREILNQQFLQRLTQHLNKMIF